MAVFFRPPWEKKKKKKITSCSCGLFKLTLSLLLTLRHLSRIVFVWEPGHWNWRPKAPVTSWLGHQRPLCSLNGRVGKWNFSTRKTTTTTQRVWALLINNEDDLRSGIWVKSRAPRVSVSTSSSTAATPMSGKLDQSSWWTRQENEVWSGEK